MDQRTIERLSVEGMVECRIDGRVSEDRLGDLSTGGCRLRGVDPAIAKGASLDLTLLDDVTVSGTVRWVAGGDVGVQFDEILSEAAVRYFTLGSLCHPARSPAVDGFGRRLPPLSEFRNPGTSPQ